MKSKSKQSKVSKFVSRVINSPTTMLVTTVARNRGAQMKMLSLLVSIIFSFVAELHQMEVMPGQRPYASVFSADTEHIALVQRNI